MLEIRLLGQFAVRLDGTPVALRSRGAERLLAYLAITAGTRHSREKLAALLWPDAIEANARDNLRHALWRIRKAIGTNPAAARDYLLTDEALIAFNDASDYWLDTASLERVEAGAVSLEEFIDLVASCQGEFLPGFYDEWVVLERERLQAVFQVKMERLLDGLVEAQRWSDVLNWGERWIALGHSPEPAYRALMVAHAASGDLSGVAAIFQRCVETLRRDLGVEPSEETRALHWRLSQGDPALGFPIGTAFQTPVIDLPAQATPFIGRRQELSEIMGLLDNPACRLLTLIGPGGIGKTRLALQAAGEKSSTFSDGVYFVSLASLSSAEYLVVALANALKFRSYGPADLKAQLLNFVQPKALLMVLDNFEHLLAGADLLAEFVSQAPAVRFLVTSRERLDLQSEWVYEVQGMLYPEGGPREATDLESYSAVQLFLQSAQRARFGFELSDRERQGVVRICQLVAGMPLGLELAAAWVRTLSCDEIASEIERNLNFLVTPMRDLPPRHRSLRAVFDQSWHLLSEQEQRVFQSVSVFRGGFGRMAAEQVADASLPVLSALLDKCLVRRNASGRYEMHELIRQYAQDKLRESGESTAVRDRHLDYFRLMAQEAEPKLHGAEQVVWLDWLEAEGDNFRAALEWSLEGGKVQAGLQLAGALWFFWFVRGYPREGEERLLASLRRPEAAASTTTRAKALIGAGYLARALGQLDSARGLFEESLTIGRDLGDDWTIAASLGYLGSLATARGDYSLAHSLLEQSLSMGRELQDQQGVVLPLMYLGDMAIGQGDLEQAQKFYEESMIVLREIQDANFLAYSLRRLGQVALQQGDPARAVGLFQESLRCNVAVGDKQGIAACLAALAGAAQAQNRSLSALRLFGATESLLNALSAPLLPFDGVEYARNVARFRAQLDNAQFVATWAEGQAMPLEKAIAYALEERPV